MNKKYIIVLSLFAGLCLPTTAQESNEEQTDKFVGQTIDVGAERLLTREEATGSVSSLVPKLPTVVVPRISAIPLLVRAMA